MSEPTCFVTADKLRDEIISHLGGTSLAGKCEVQNNRGWQISFKGLSTNEFDRLANLATQYLEDANIGIEVGFVRWFNLTDLQARRFARAVAVEFRA